jgi:hypothetical protein
MEILKRKRKKRLKRREEEKKRYVASKTFGIFGVPKQKLREFITTRPGLPKLFEGVWHPEVKEK